MTKKATKPKESVPVKCPACGADAFPVGPATPAFNNNSYAETTPYFCENCLYTFSVVAKVEERDPTKPEELDSSMQVFKKNKKK